MYSPAFQTVIADARIENLRRAHATSTQSHQSRADRNPRPVGRWELMSRAGIRRLIFADPSRAN